VIADAAPRADDAERPLPVAERVAALDVLRGFALLGIFIMNIPGFSHSMFAPPAPLGTLDAVVAALREMLFAGKFNLLFGLAFGVGFALQMGRLERLEGARAAQRGEPARPGRAARLYARRLSFLFAVGLVHAMLLWSGDVLLIYAVLGLALLAIRRLDDRVLYGLIALCLVFPAVAEVLRASVFPDGFDAIAAFQYQQLEAGNDLAFGAGSFLDAMRETSRIFDWSWRSPFGLFAYAAFFVQMATGILAGFILGRRGWPARPLAGVGARAGWTAAALALAGALLEALAALFLPGDAAVFFSTLARTLGRAALSACYAIVIVRVVGRRPALAPPWRWLALAGRMPLSNYLLQTALASALFYGWGLGLWNTTGPALETAIAVFLFCAVQLPLSAAWLAHFRQGPLEGLWRRFTYGAPAR
jgi:uncharacterized protein